MSFRVPMLRGNTFDTGYLPHGVTTKDRTLISSDPITQTLFPAALTAQAHTLCLRVQQWKISIDATFDFMPDTNPADDVNGVTVNVSDGIMAAYADSYTHWHDINGGAAMGVVDFPADHTIAGNHPGLQVDHEYGILSNFTRDNREFNGPLGGIDLPNMRGDIAPFMIGCASQPSDTAPRMYQQVIHDFGGTFSGTWIDIGGGLTYTGAFLTFINPQIGNAPDNDASFCPTWYDPVTRLVYPLIYFNCAIGIGVTHEQLQVLKDATSRPQVGTFTIHIPASSNPLMARPDDIDINITMWRSTPTANFRFPTNSIEVTIEPLKWYPFKNSTGEEVYDTGSGDIRAVSGVPVDPFS